MDEGRREYKDVVEAIYRITATLERKFDALREADRAAVVLAHADLSHRLEGFPQQFATKDEMSSALQALQRLEKDAVTREIYETQSRALAEAVAKLDKEMMPEKEFQTFVENYRIEQENAANERRAVASALAATSSRQQGAQATWGRIAAVSVGISTVVVGLIGTAIVIANWLSGQ